MLERPLVSPSNFAEKSRCWEGNTPVGNFERLAQEFVNPQAQLQYRICGELDARGRPRLRSRILGGLQVECQRCLKPLDVSVDSEHVLYLARDEGEAERLETALANEALEVIVVGQTLDLATVVEDEVLLSLPLMLVHDECAHEYERVGSAT